MGRVDPWLVVWFPWDVEPDRNNFRLNNMFHLHIIDELASSITREEWKLRRRKREKKRVKSIDYTKVQMSPSFNRIGDASNNSICTELKLTTSWINFMYKVDSTCGQFFLINSTLWRLPESVWVDVVLIISASYTYTLSIHLFQCDLWKTSHTQEPERLKLSVVNDFLGNTIGFALMALMCRSEPKDIE